MSHRKILGLLSILFLAAFLFPIVVTNSANTLSQGYTDYFSSSVRLAVQLELNSAFLESTSAVSGNDVTVTFDPNHLPQNEPSVSVNPLNPSNLVVGANDYRLLAFGQSVWLGAYASFDGGLTWTQQLMPGFPGDSRTTALTGFHVASDPSVAFDGNGNLYYGGLVFRVQPHRALDGSIFISKSTDGGLSFTQTVLVTEGSRNVFNDKPYISVDNTGGAFDGRVYVSWTRFASTADIMVSYSTDGGTAFSTPKRLSSSPLNQGSIPVVGPLGELYVVWNDMFNDRIMVARSMDGGVSFSSPVPIASYTPLPVKLSNSLFRVNNNPASAVDEINGYVYVSWADYATGDADILFSRSLDGGFTWSAPLRVNDDDMLNDQFFPWMSVSSGRLSIVFYDRREDPGNHLIDVFYADSVDGGASFLSNVRVTDVPSNPDAVLFGQESFIGDYIGVASTTTTVYPVWTDLRNVTSTTPRNQDIWIERLGRRPVLDPILSMEVDEEQLLAFTVRAVDPDTGEKLMLNATGLPEGAEFSTSTLANGTVIGSFTWTPSEAQGPAPYSFTVAVSDGLFTETRDVHIEVNEVNVAPILSVPDLQAVDEETPLAFTVTAGDPDLDANGQPLNTITLSCDNCNVVGAMFDSTPGKGTVVGTFTWTPAEGQAPKLWVLSLTATDDGSPSGLDAKTIAIDVREVNETPVITVIGLHVVDESTFLEFTITAHDPDIDASGQPLDTITLSASGLPAGASFPTITGGSPVTATFSWVPGEAQDGDFTVTFLAVDGGFPALSDSVPVVIQVNEVDLVPTVIVPGTQTVELGGTLTFGVRVTDPDIPGNAIELSCDICFEIGAIFDPDTGVFSWTPSREQGPGVYTPRFTATEVDGASLSDSETVTITVREPSRSVSPLFGLEDLGLQLLGFSLLATLIFSTILGIWWRKKSR